MTNVESRKCSGGDRTPRGLWLLAAMLLAGCGGENPAASGNGTAGDAPAIRDLRFIPPEAVAGFVVRPSQLLAEPAMQNVTHLAHFVDMDDFSENFGMALEDIDQVVVFLVPLEIEGSEPFPGLIFRAKQPLDQQRIVEESGRDGLPAKAIEVSGQTIYCLPNPYGYRQEAPEAALSAALYFPDDNTFVFTLEEALTALLNEQETRSFGSLAKMFADIGSEPDFAAAFAAEANPRFAARFRAEVADRVMVYPFATAKSLPKQVDRGIVVFDLAADTVLSIELTAADEAVVGEVKDTVETLVAITRGMLDGMVEDGPEDGIYSRPIFSAIYRQLETVLSRVTVKANGRRIVANARNPGNWEQWTDELTPLLRKQQEARERNRREAEKEMDKPPTVPPLHDAEMP